MALNLLLRPSGTRAAHVTARGRERAPFSQAVRVLLKTVERPVLVESIRENPDGSFTGQLCAPKSDSPAPAGSAGRESVHFREEHVFTYETAEDLVRRGMAPEMLDVVQQFDRTKFDDEPLKALDDQLSAFKFDAVPGNQLNATAPQALATEQRSSPPIPPDADRPRQRLPQLMAIGGVCIALVLGVGVGFILGSKPERLGYAVQPQVSEPANLRLDYDLRKR